MKHTLAYLSATPPAFAQLQRRIDSENRQVKAMSILAKETTEALDIARAKFDANPTLENARAWTDAFTRMKSFAAHNFLASEASASAQRQDSIRYANDTLDIYIGILEKVRELLQRDLSEKEQSLLRAIGDIDADNIDVQLLAPLPSIRAKIQHVGELVDRLTNRANEDRRWASDAAHRVICENGLAAIHPPTPPPPPRQKSMMELAHEEQLA